MPRRRRIHIDGLPLHIVLCCHNREACFFCDEDHQAYLPIARVLCGRVVTNPHSFKRKPICSTVSVTSSSPSARGLKNRHCIAFAVIASRVCSERINTFRHIRSMCLLEKIPNLGKPPTEMGSEPNLTPRHSVTSGKHLHRTNLWETRLSTQSSKP